MAEWLTSLFSGTTGRKTVRYLVPEMKEILSNTYGIMVYQEQIMQLAQKLAGYTLSEADLMRSAMGKKKREEMAVHEEKFISGAIERGIKEGEGREDFLADGQVFRLWLSSQPQRCVCLSGVSNCIPEGALPRAFLRGGSIERGPGCR